MFHFLLLLPLLFSDGSVSHASHCELKGAVYVERVAGLADYRVFLLEEESLADLLVYREEAREFCEEEGHWYFTSNRAEADFIIYMEENSALADFLISYTDLPSFAGCQQ